MKNRQPTVGVTLKLSKLEAARRQLETAIILFFQKGDAVSIHTLATAAAEVICNLNTARGGKPMMLDLHDIKPEHRDELRKAFRKAQNFFKHAKKDPDAILKFNPESTEFFLFDAGEKYRELSGEFPAILNVFWLWFRCRRPEAFFRTEDERRRFSNAIHFAATTDKTKYFADTLPVCYAQMSNPNYVKLKSKD